MQTYPKLIFSKHLFFFPRSLLSVLQYFLLLGLIQSLYAWTWNRNESHLKWKVAETEHFRFYYDAKLEPVAARAATLAEEAYENKQKRYLIQLPGKVDFMLREGIEPIGWARAGMNTMEIGITDWDFPLRSTNNWLADVVTHEFSHIISIQAGSKLHPSILGLVLGYQDYYNESIQSSLLTIVPNQTQPNWFAEGVAQYESELMGHDNWDAHRDMVLRMAVLHDSLLSYDRMGVFVGRNLHFEQGPYTQGYSLVRYISSKYGDEAVRRIWAENSRIHRQNFSASIKRVLGISAEELWHDWSTELKAQYSGQKNNLGKLVEGIKVSPSEHFAFHPRWINNDSNLYFVTTLKDQRGLYRIEIPKSIDTIQKGWDKTPTLVTPAIKGYFNFRPADSSFVVASAKDPDKLGVSRFDLYLKRYLLREKPPKKKKLPKGSEPEFRITREVNALQADFHPSGKSLVFVREELSNFSLCISNISELEESIETEDLNCPWPTDKDRTTEFGFNIYTPKWSPDGKKIAFSYFDGTRRGLGIYEVETEKFHSILVRKNDDRDPIWDEKGEGLYFSSDISGIFNIYHLELKTSQITRVTNVLGGAFSPSLSPSGSRIAYLGFDKDGFSIYSLNSPKSNSSLQNSLIAKDSSASDLVQDSQLTKNFLDSLASKNSLQLIQKSKEKANNYALDGISTNYLPLPTRLLWQPIFIGQERASVDTSVEQGSSSWLLGSSVFLMDPVGKNEISLTLLLGLGNGWDYLDTKGSPLNANKDSEFSLGYLNRSTPVDISVGFSRTNVATFDYVTNQSEGQAGEGTRERENHALIIKDARATAQYNLLGGGRFEDPGQSSFVSLMMGHTWMDLDFYELPFSFTYYQNTDFQATLGYYGVDPESEVLVAPRGLASFFNYGLHFANLVRENSNEETFIVENGVIKTNFKDYTLHEFDAGIDWGLPIYGSKKSSLRLSILAGSLLSWKRTDQADVDTLNRFFERGLSLRGYPLLMTREYYAFAGENTLKLSADLNQVIWKEIYRGWEPLFIEDLYAHFFVEAGRAWYGKLWDLEVHQADSWGNPSKRDAWYRSIGWGLKLNSLVYHSFPFTGYIEFARALDDLVGEKMEVISQSDLKLAGVPTFATRISLGVSFGFYNGLLSKEYKTVRVKNPHLHRYLP